MSIYVIVAVADSYNFKNPELGSTSPLERILSTLNAQPIAPLIPFIIDMVTYTPFYFIAENAGRVTALKFILDSPAPGTDGFIIGQWDEDGNQVEALDKVSLLLAQPDLIVDSEGVRARPFVLVNIVKPNGWPNMVLS